MPTKKTNLQAPNANEWGRKRVNFYVNATSRVREDGPLNDEEQELLELEEEDAVQRQHKSDFINSAVDYRKLDVFEDISDDEGESNLVVQRNLTAQSQFSDGGLKRITLTKTFKPNSMGQRRLEAQNLQKNADRVVKTVTKKRVRFAPTTKKADLQENRKADFVEGWNDEPKTVKNEDNRRQITYEMQKNKGLIQKRKKESRHSRVKRRAQYKKALIKRRSQVPDVKREVSKYAGEARGIRMSTVRSVPLKA